MRVGNVVARIEKAGYEPYLGTLETEADRATVHNVRLIQASDGRASRQTGKTTQVSCEYLVSTRAPA